MNLWKPSRYALVWCLALLIAVPMPIIAQETSPDAARTGARAFSQPELDQLLAPIALYPDSLLAHLFIAATYPLEVVLAERWARENRSLPAESFNAALEKQNWDPSVKALVPFPDVLEMMSRKLDWTEKVGNAFLAQQADVMDTVQRLRKRAHDAGSLKSTEQQKVIVERDVIRVEPSSPSIVYVPVYDPWWVYGPWWWPAYPPYVVYPYPAGVAIAPGVIWFGTGLFVGAYWGSWGYWGWHNHTCYVNRAYFRGGYGSRGGQGGGAVGGAWATRQQGAPGASGAAGGVAAAQPWRHDPAHRRGVAYRDTATGERYGRTNRAAVENRRSFRGHEASGAGRTAGAESPAMSARGTARPDPSAVREALSARAGRTGAPGRNDALSLRTGRADAVFSRAGRPDRDGRGEIGRAQAGAERRPDRAVVERGLAGRAFEGIGRGGEVRRQSAWGRGSLDAARTGGGRPGDAVRGFPQGRAAAGSAVRGMPQVSGRAGDAPRTFPQGSGGAGGGFFRGGHR